MTWTKIGDGFIDEPQLLSVSRGARLVHIEGLVWSNRHGTDGRIPRHVLSRLTDQPDPEAAIDELRDAGLWDIDGDDGWRILTFLQDQPSAAEVAEAKARAATRTKRWNAHRNGDHSLCRPDWCRKAQRVTNAVADASTDDLSTRPDPTRPEGRREGSVVKGHSERPTQSGVQGPALVGSVLENLVEGGLNPEIAAQLGARKKAS